MAQVIQKERPDVPTIEIRHCLEDGKNVVVSFPPNQPPDLRNAWENMRNQVLWSSSNVLRVVSGEDYVELSVRSEGGKDTLLTLCRNGTPLAKSFDASFKVVPPEPPTTKSPGPQIITFELLTKDLPGLLSDTLHLPSRLDLPSRVQITCTPEQFGLFAAHSIKLGKSNLLTDAVLHVLITRRDPASVIPYFDITPKGVE